MGLLLDEPAALTQERTLSSRLHQVPGGGSWGISGHQGCTWRGWVAGCSFICVKT